MTSAPSGPNKHRRNTLLSEEEYRCVPGRDPDADRHGEGTYNPYKELLHYCALDVESLAQVWQAWREVMVEATSYDGSAVPPAHAACAASAVGAASAAGAESAAGGAVGEAHSPLIEAEGGRHLPRENRCRTPWRGHRLELVVFA